jgi:hypothetical protein
MTLINKQLIIWVVTALLIAVLAFWYGESAREPFGGVYLVMIYSIPMLLILMFVLNAIIKQKWFIHFFVGLAFFVLLAIAFSYGSSSAQNAYNDCVDHGEKVRLALQDFYTKNKAYPKTLAELNNTLPGDLILHSNLLRYETTKEGYILRFDDRFITFEATESLQFEASK